MKEMTNVEFLNNNMKNNGFEIHSLCNFFESSIDTAKSEGTRVANYTFIYLTEGSIIYEIDLMEYKVSSGEMLLISVNRNQKLLEKKDPKGYIIVFTEGFLCEYLSYNSSDVKELFNKSLLNPHLKSLDVYKMILKKQLEHIDYYYQKRNEVIDNSVVASVFRTFILILINAELVLDTNQRSRNETFIEFSRLVMKHINEEKTVEAYANMMHLSKKTINQMTRRAIDKSAKQYIIEQLILKIKLKLSFEKLTISEVAYELGFKEIASMTKFFKKYTDLTPSDFRKINRKKHTDLNYKDIDINYLKDSMEAKLYHIKADRVVPLHSHDNYVEVFYVIKGTGHLIINNSELLLDVGESFVVSRSTKHSLKTEGELYVAAFLIPIID